MADREFVFGHPEVQKLLREHFILVAADDWYQRRQKDAVGTFFRSVADQGPRKGAGGGTRQGRYAFTASGKLLGFNNNRDPRRIINMLQDSLRRFRALPAAERRPGALKVPDLPLSKRDPRYARPVEADTIPVKVHTRALNREGDSYTACREPEPDTTRFRHKGLGVATDHLWVKKTELTKLTSPGPSGTSRSLPPALAMRIARFHLVDNTRGEPPHWRRDEVRKLELEVSPLPDPSNPRAGKRVRVRGLFHLETKDRLRGYKGELDGFIHSMPASNQLELKLVAVGNHWGHGPYTRGARPGKTPLAVVFTLADREKTEDQIPPQAARWEQGYWEADQH